MLSSVEIKNAKFAKSISGYKQEDVDILLDKVEADYAQYERIVRDFHLQIEKLNRELKEYRDSQDSIQNVLLSAQRLADKIVGEAKEKSDEIIRNAETNISVITAKEKELVTSFEMSARERKNALEKELQEMVNEAQKKAEGITAAAEDSVARQKLLFDKLKLEVAAFKSNITSKYKEHLESLSAIPDSVPADPKQIAEIVSASVDKVPDANKFVPKKENDTKAEEIKPLEQEIIEEPPVVVEQKNDDSLNTPVRKAFDYDKEIDIVTY